MGGKGEVPLPGKLGDSPPWSARSESRHLLAHK